MKYGEEWRENKEEKGEETEGRGKGEGTERESEE